MKLLVIIPAFNEAANIESVIKRVRAAAPEVGALVIDDGSTDATAEIARRCGVKIVRHPFNLGYGAAVQTGLLYALRAGCEVCLLMDGDGQHDPALIPRLIEPVIARRADVVIGSRFLDAEAGDVRRMRQWGIKVFGKIASICTGRRVTDPTSGFQAISRQALKFLVRDNYPYDFPDADTIIRLSFAGFRVEEAPVTSLPRLSGVSMHTPATSVYYLYKMLFSIFVALTERRTLAKGARHAD